MILKNEYSCRSTTSTREINTTRGTMYAWIKKVANGTKRNVKYLSY